MKPHGRIELLALAGVGLLVGQSTGTRPHHLADDDRPPRRLRHEFVWTSESEDENDAGGPPEGDRHNYLDLFTLAAATDKPSRRPTPRPTPRPSPKPSRRPSPQPSRRPSPQPSRRPSPQPLRRPSPQPSPRPSPKPSPKPSAEPSPKPSPQQTKQPTPNPTAPKIQQVSFFPEHPGGRCFTKALYDALDRDIQRLADAISNKEQRGHFFGGIVRLAAHDFLDFDRRNRQWPMGPDGCFNTQDTANDGLLEKVWCDDCPSGLKRLFDNKYSQFVSRADFWVAAANAAIRQTSVDNALDLKATFQWGRRDRDRCFMAKTRLPRSSGCDQIEEAMLGRMGLSWKDAVALMGAHTLGGGHAEFSGHPGRWVDTNEEATVFDKKYYEAMFLHSWRPREPEGAGQDWTTGRNGDERVMLNTDMCLVFDIDDISRSKCCSRTGHTFPNGDDACLDDEAARRKCPMYGRGHSRFAAREAVGEMLGGAHPNDNNGPFYDAFTHAWEKATTLGQGNLSPLVDRCDELV